MSRFQFVADNSATFEVKRLCELVEIERSSYYAWKAGAPARAARAAADAALAHGSGSSTTADNTVGAPRVTAELNDGAPAEERVNHKRVARVMRAAGIAGYVKKRRVRTTIPEPSDQKVPDLLKRDFTADAPGLRYVGDITYLPTRRRVEPVPRDRDRLLLPTARRLGDRRPHAHQPRRRRPQGRRRDPRQPLAGAIFHSDHGSVYTSKDYAKLCSRASASPSPWVPSEPRPTTRSRSRSTPP